MPLHLQSLVLRQLRRRLRRLHHLRLHPSHWTLRNRIMRSLPSFGASFGAVADIDIYHVGFAIEVVQDAVAHVEKHERVDNPAAQAVWVRNRADEALAQERLATSDPEAPAHPFSILKAQAAKWHGAWNPPASASGDCHGVLRQRRVVPEPPTCTVVADLSVEALQRAARPRAGPTPKEKMHAGGKGRCSLYVSEATTTATGMMLMTGDSDDDDDYDVVVVVDDADIDED